MQPVGSETTPQNPSTDGPKDLAVSPPAKRKYTKIKKDSAPIGTPAAELLKAGLSPTMARRIIMGSEKGSAILSRRVMSKVMMSYWFGSVEDIAKAQRRLTEMISNPDLDPEAQITAAGMIAQLAIALVRTGDGIIDRAPDESPSGNNGEQTPRTQVNVQFNLPPVAKPVSEAISGAATEV